MACSWDIPMVREVASSFGNEGKDYGVDILLGPALNIMRDPLDGRNFEYYSEDPLISGIMATAYVEGIQSTGLGATLKHFAANNQETNRIICDSRVSVRALREIYLRGFEYTVKHAHPWSIMTAYNRLNGTQCGESRDLIKKVARGDWGFKGIMMTDFGGEGWSPLQIAAGNDIVMPGSSYHVQNIIDAVNRKKLKMADLDICCKRILDYIQKTLHYKKYKYSSSPDLVAHAKVARDAARETFVLLKNNGTLPLNVSATPAFFGVGSYDTKVSGIGSGKVESDYVINIADGFTQKNQMIANYYSNLIKNYQKSATSGMKFSQRAKVIEKLIYPEELPGADSVRQIVNASSAGIFTITRNAGEGADRKPVEGDWLLSQQEKRTMEQLANAYHAAGKKFIVLLNIAGAIETASWKDIPDAIMSVWLPGQEGGNAIADVMTGKESPSGKLTFTLPLNYQDCPTFGNFPIGTEDQIVSADKNGFIASKETMKVKSTNSQSTIFKNGMIRYVDKPKNEMVKNIDYTNYEEDVYVGYRYYDTFKKDVSYPFGFGLSYTTFSYSNLQVIPTKDGYDVSVRITNSGQATGKEVAEVYSSAPVIKEGRPVKELVAFGKTKELKPGESEILHMQFTKRNLCWYDSNKSAWMLQKGKYLITCAPSSRERGQSVSISIVKTTMLEKTSTALLPQYKLNLMKPVE
jgi:beta-glucosidase